MIMNSNDQVNTSTEITNLVRIKMIKAFDDIERKFDKNLTDLTYQRETNEIRKKLPVLSEIADIISKTHENVPYDKLKESHIRIKDNLNEKNIQCEDLKQKLKQLETKKAEYEMQISAIKQKILQGKQKHLRMRNEILIYKLLTHTTFMHASKNVKGYVICEKCNHILDFNLNPQTYSAEEITKKLYSYINASASCACTHLNVT